MNNIYIAEQALSFIQSQSNSQQLDFFSAVRDIINYGVTLLGPNSVYFIDEDEFSVSFIKNKHIEDEALKVMGRVASEDKVGVRIELYKAVSYNANGQLLDRCSGENGAYIALTKEKLEKLNRDNPFLEKAYEAGQYLGDAIAVHAYVRNMAHTDFSQVRLFKKHADKYGSVLANHTSMFLPHITYTSLSENEIDTLDKLVRHYKQSDNDYFIVVNFIDQSDDLSFVHHAYMNDFIGQSRHQYYARNIAVIDVEITPDLKTNESYLRYRNRVPELWRNDARTFSAVIFEKLDDYETRKMEEGEQVVFLSASKLKTIYINCLCNCDQGDEELWNKQIKKNIKLINHELFAAISSTPLGIGVCFKNLQDKSDAYVEKAIQALAQDSVVVKIAGDMELVSRVGDICASVKRYGFPNVGMVRIHGSSNKLEILVCDAKEEIMVDDIEDSLSNIIEILYEVHLLPKMKGNLTAQDFYSPFNDGVHELVKAQCNQEKSIII